MYLLSLGVKGLKERMYVLTHPVWLDDDARHEVEEHVVTIRSLGLQHERHIRRKTTTEKKGRGQPEKQYCVQRDRGN